MFSVETIEELRSELTASDEQIAAVRKALKGFADMHLDGCNDNLAPQLYVMSRTYAASAVKPVELDDPAVTIFALLVPFNTDLEKRSALFRIGRQLNEAKKIPLIIGLVSECWRSTRMRDEPRKYLLPEDDPNREEGLQYVVAASGGCCYGFRGIRRDAQMNMLSEGDWEDSDQDGKCESPLLAYVIRGWGSRHNSRSQ